LRMSTVFHPQTDRQSKVVTKVIAMYLHCVTGDRPRSWVFIGCHGRSTATTPPSIRPCVPLCSRWSMAAHPLRCYHIGQVGTDRHGRRLTPQPG
jgi:hypothetical protein